MLFSVIPAKAGIQLLHYVLDPGACPGHDPGFAGVTAKETLTRECRRSPCLLLRREADYKSSGNYSSK
jgi:hypothetical protein